MKQLLFVCVLTLLCVHGNWSTGNAAVSERNWKNPGDGLLTYDDVNQREWLDLSVSTIAQFPEPKEENALAEINAGGLFAGFTLAKRDDVLGLAISAGIDPTTDSFARNASAVQNLIELLSPTPPFTETTLHSIGFVDEIPKPPFPPFRESADFRLSPLSGPNGRAGVSIFEGNDALAFGTAGLMLFRVVPEPESFALIASIILPVAVCCRRRQ